MGRDVIIYYIDTWCRLNLRLTGLNKSNGDLNTNVKYQGFNSLLRLHKYPILINLKILCI